MKKASAAELDRMFEDGEDLSEYMDLANVTRIREPDIKRVNVDFPVWMVAALDQEAARLAVPRQAVIKTLVDEGLRSRRQKLVSA